MNNLPSKKVFSILILSIALVVSIIIAFGREKTGTVVNVASNLVAGDKISVPENPNWQDELSKVSITSSDLPETTEASADTSNMTDVVSQSLMSNYLALKQNGSLDTESAKKLVNQTANYIQNTGVANISTPKLNIIADNGKITITQYGENLGNAIKNKKPSDLKEELGTIVKIVSSGDKTKLAELDPIIAEYKTISLKLVQMPIPQTFVKAHTDIVFGIEEMIASLEQMKTLNTDPFAALSAVGLYQKGLTTTIGAMQATVSFILKNNIAYKQGSGGYYLLYGI